MLVNLRPPRIHPALVICALLALLAVALIVESLTRSAIAAVAACVIVVGIAAVKSWYIGDLGLFRRD